MLRSFLQSHGSHTDSRVLPPTRSRSRQHSKPTAFFRYPSATLTSPRAPMGGAPTDNFAPAAVSTTASTPGSLRLTARERQAYCLRCKLLDRKPVAPLHYTTPSIRRLPRVDSVPLPLPTSASRPVSSSPIANVQPLVLINVSAPRESGVLPYTRKSVNWIFTHMEAILPPVLHIPRGRKARNAHEHSAMGALRGQTGGENRPLHPLNRSFFALCKFQLRE